MISLPTPSPLPQFSQCLHLHPLIPTRTATSPTTASPTAPSLCNHRYSVYEYRPSTSANATFLCLFGLAMIIHVILGLKWLTWAFVFAMFWGCIAEIIGYSARIMLWEDPLALQDS